MSDTIRPSTPAEDNLAAPAQRLLALLCDRASGAELSRAEQDELDELLRRVPPIADAHGLPITPDSIDFAAAAVMLAFDAPSQPLPADVRERLLARGVEVTRELGAGANARAAVGHETRTGASRAGGPLMFLGWLTAAAAVVLACVMYLRTLPSPAPSAALLRTALLGDPGTITTAWLPQKPYDAAGVNGDVVWNNQKQEGFMRFKNLAALDPSKEQYQLWIFDAGRKNGEKYPVDGGVFDVGKPQLDPATGEHVVRISAKLPVVRPSAFAVTVEKAGGVVVADRDRVVALAPVKGQ